MTRTEKDQLIDELAVKIDNSNVFYLADTSDLTADMTSSLRRSCFQKDVKLSVVKNTLLKKAFEKIEGRDFSELFEMLSGPTSIMFAEAGNAPARLIKEFRKKSDKPILKAAYIEEMIYLGDEQLETLTLIKSREELIGDVIGLLQSPMKNLIGALQSGGNTLSGLVKALEDRG